MVPTIAMETYATRNLNYLANMVDAQGQPYFNIFWTEPAQAVHDWPDFGDVMARQLQAAVMARHSGLVEAGMGRGRRARACFVTFPCRSRSPTRPLTWFVPSKYWNFSHPWMSPLAEFARVLRAGGIFLTSRGTEESGRKAKVKSVPEYTSLLERHGFENIRITTWWKVFDRTLAVKRGMSQPAGVRKLSDVLRCSVCGQSQWEKETGALKCRNCGKKLSVTGDGIVLN